MIVRFEDISIKTTTVIDANGESADMILKSETLGINGTLVANYIPVVW